MPVTARYKGLPDLRFTYRGCRVSMEAAHTVGDGRGSMRVFEELLCRYTALQNGETAAYAPIASPEVTGENAFDTYYQKGGDKNSGFHPKAYHFRERYERDYLKLLFAETSAAAVKNLAHAHDMTVTEYLSAVLILGVLRSAGEPVNAPVTIAVPVDLRRFFPTGTLRNFTVQAYITFEPKGRTDLTLETVLEETAGQLRASLTTENLQKTLNRYGGLKRNPVIRVVPYFIKKPVLVMMQKSAHKEITTIFTNLGDRELPPALAAHTRRLQFVNGDTRRYGLPVTCSCITFSDRLSFCFSRANRDTGWFDSCMEILREEGLVVETAFTEGSAKPDRPAAPNRPRMPLRESLKAFFNI